MYLPTCTIYQRLSFNPRPHLKVVYCFITEIASDSGSALQIMITLQEIYVCKCNNLRRNEEADNTSLLYKSNTNYYYYFFFLKQHLHVLSLCALFIYHRLISNIFSILGYNDVLYVIVIMGWKIPASEFSLQV